MEQSQPFLAFLAPSCGVVFQLEKVGRMWRNCLVRDFLGEGEGDGGWNTHQELKSDLKDLYINSASQIDVAGDKKAVVVHVSFKATYAAHPTDDVLLHFAALRSWRTTSPRAAHAAAAVGTMVLFQSGIGPARHSTDDLYVLDMSNDKYKCPRGIRVSFQIAVLKRRLGCFNGCLDLLKNCSLIAVLVILKVADLIVADTNKSHPLNFHGTISALPCIFGAKLWGSIPAGGKISCRIFEGTIRWLEKICWEDVGYVLDLLGVCRKLGGCGGIVWFVISWGKVKEMEAGFYGYGLGIWLGWALRLGRGIMDRIWLS
ncbi:serine/threonine-protein phosphatase BSL1 [Artemisia annua]|uniref:Serine/threonine-protein phosphatase BSL1 n=1 Tax=Artemisia annua TaxID=35608 RepID=A0A2U1PRW2_ARTAN|nr:serine/threonine-protein phosphatase BSL1 [Artemisia annua]